MNYTYKSLSVPGGGFVTGFLFHPEEKDILYCRTDIGGVYRYDFKDNLWISLVDQVTDVEKWKTYPLSIALDPRYPNRLYMSVGEHHQSAIGYSEDYGQNFTYLATPKNDRGLPVEIHGNAPGRSTGERLLVDPYNSDILYLGTMFDGLFVTRDRCKTWTRLVLGSFDEKNIAFVAVDERAGMVTESNESHAKRILVATSGQEGSPDGKSRGPSIYISHDGGESFQVMDGQPQAVLEGSDDHPGYVGQRIAFDEKYTYITYSSYNIGWSNWNMYGCDTGKCSDGALFRYAFDDKGKMTEALDITPSHPVIEDYLDDSKTEFRLGYGLSGICTDLSQPGFVILSTITGSPDVFYRSSDYGLTFEPIMAGLEIGQIDFNVSYQHPKYNGNRSLIHWMSDIKINPFDSDMALFNTGAGVFATHNLSHKDGVVFASFSQGMEETVHLNVYAPLREKPGVIDVIGDYGLFVFDDVNHQPETSASDSEGNRWITAMNADFTDYEDGVIISTLRGNWTGETKGGLVISYDNGKTFEKLPDPGPINGEIDQAIDSLKTPNVTSGWVAMSSDTSNIVWAIGLPLNGDLVVFSHDGGLTYGKTLFLAKSGEQMLFHGSPVKIFSDRVDPHTFYGFADLEDGPSGFISKDGGESFSEITLPMGFPNCLLAGIDSEQKYEIRPLPRKSGAFYIALEEEGLWLLDYSDAKSGFLGECLSQPGDVIKRIGIGVNDQGELIRLYTSGTIEGVYGFYLSNDGGWSWTRVNDDDHQFGDIRSIDGDKHVAGRFYVATGARGLIYGEPKSK